MNTIIFFRRNTSYSQTIILLICLFLFLGCEDFLETEDPTGQISPENVYENETTATAAVTTMYAKLRDEVLLTGNTAGLGIQMGLYADELDYYGAPAQSFDFIFQHQILASDVSISKIWNSSYNLIYLTNAAIEGLETSETLSDKTKNQLLGEAQFIRALTYFYLINLFGDVPYCTTTNYETNRKATRLSVNIIYTNIVQDLNDAKTKLGDTYTSSERVRANKWVASALLARVYLYMEQWENAENESSLLIDNTSLYTLETNLKNEFLKTSLSAILQLKTKVAGFSPAEANTFTFVTGPPPIVAMNKDLSAKMENGDLRRLHWVGQVSSGSRTWFYSDKYKQGISSQYSTIFRLAEQFLIRAEARVQIGKLSGGKQDINTIRLRAGLPNTPANTIDELLKAIIKERQFELFAEYGHRWFDLRRWGIAEDVLNLVKPGWKQTDIRLPLPETELSMNPNLNPQNPGY